MIVVDASALLTALLEVGEARRRLEVEPLNAPDVLDLEVVSAMRGLVRGGEITASRAVQSLSELSELLVVRHRAAPLVPRIWALRSNLTAYDACYVALAERLGCPLVTADARIARAAGPRCPVEVVA